MFSHRHRPHSHHQPPSEMNPYALAAARASTPAPRSQTPTLSQSAAAAALHSSPKPTTSPATIVTKRMERRNSETSLVRRGSESSMSERIGWLREGSPGSRSQSRDNFSNGPWSNSFSTGGSSSAPKKAGLRNTEPPSSRGSNSTGALMEIPKKAASTARKNKSPPVPKFGGRRRQGYQQTNGEDYVPDVSFHEPFDRRGVTKDEAQSNDFGGASPSNLRQNVGLRTSMHAPHNAARARQGQGPSPHSFSSRLKAGTMRTEGTANEERTFDNRLHRVGSLRAKRSEGTRSHPAASSSSSQGVNEQAVLLARQIMLQQQKLLASKQISSEVASGPKKKRSRGRSGVSAEHDGDTGSADHPGYAASVSSVGSWASDLQMIPEERYHDNIPESSAKKHRKRRERGTPAERILPGREGVPDLPSIPSLGDLEEPYERHRGGNSGPKEDKKSIEVSEDANPARKSRRGRLSSSREKTSKLSPSSNVKQPASTLIHDPVHIPPTPESIEEPAQPFIRTIPATPPVALVDIFISPPASTSETESAKMQVNSASTKAHAEPSPTRGASLSLKHSPPPRSLSPGKSALKGGSSGSVSGRGDMSDNSSIMSGEDAAKSAGGSRRRNVRVSFSEEPNVVEMAEEEYLYSPLAQDYEEYDAGTKDIVRKGVKDISFIRVTRPTATVPDVQVLGRSLEEHVPSADEPDHNGRSHELEKLPSEAPDTISGCDENEDLILKNDPDLKSSARQASGVVSVDRGPEKETTHSPCNETASPGSDQGKVNQNLALGLLDMPGLFPSTPMEEGTSTEYPLGAASSSKQLVAAPLNPDTLERSLEEERYESDSGESIYSDAYEAFGDLSYNSSKKLDAPALPNTQSNAMEAISNGASSKPLKPTSPRDQSNQRLLQGTSTKDSSERVGSTPRPARNLRRSASSSSLSHASESSFRRKYSNTSGGRSAKKGMTTLRKTMRSSPSDIHPARDPSANGMEPFAGLSKGLAASRWAKNPENGAENGGRGPRDKPPFQIGFRGRQSTTNGIFGTTRPRQREYSPDSSDEGTAKKKGVTQKSKPGGFFGRGSLRNGDTTLGDKKVVTSKQIIGERSWQSRFADSSSDDDEDVISRRSGVGRPLSPDSSDSSLNDGLVGRDSVGFREQPDRAKTDSNITIPVSKKRWWNRSSKGHKGLQETKRLRSAVASQTSDMSRPSSGFRRETNPERSTRQNGSIRSFRLSGFMSTSQRHGANHEIPNTRINRLEEEDEEVTAETNRFHSTEKKKKFPKLRRMFGIID